MILYTRRAKAISDFLGIIWTNLLEPISCQPFPSQSIYFQENQYYIMFIFKIISAVMKIFPIVFSTVSNNSASLPSCVERKFQLPKIKTNLMRRVSNPFILDNFFLMEAINVILSMILFESAKSARKLSQRNRQHACCAF